MKNIRIFIFELLPEIELDMEELEELQEKQEKQQMENKTGGRINN